MATAVQIRRDEMAKFLENNGFQPMTLPGTAEMVYGKVVDKTPGKEISLRVYTSIDGDVSRDVGADAIRLVVVTRLNGQPKVIGTSKRVHRVAGWMSNLQERIDDWREQLGPDCPKCNHRTVLRKGKNGKFWGCCSYPNCNGTRGHTG